MGKDVDLSRRKFLRNGAGVIIGGAIAGGIGSSIISPREAHAAPVGWMPKPPYAKPIDPKAVRALCYRHYLKSGG